MERFSRIMGMAVTLALLCTAGTAHGQERTSAAAPNIRFSDVRYDAGTVTEGAVVNHTFAFANVGQSVLRIRDVIPA